ncbi:50S ribosomal protein L24 [Rickettsia endosymbiont of Cardiosporidium cionae]|nr:50S ribosomal protein L24 [Rickettsia endosymbiont of Cardiosporidium cionae]
MKFRKGDKVKVIAGKDRGKIGAILRSIPSELRVVVSGVNLCKRHLKPTKDREGGIITKELSIDISNISHIDPKSNKVTKIGYKISKDGKKQRFAKISGEIIKDIV